MGCQESDMGNYDLDNPFGTYLIPKKKGDDKVEVIELHWLLRKYYPDVSIRFA